MATVREHLTGYIRSLRHQPHARRRAWIIVASLLVCAYSFGVLVYVVASPEIGVRCAFTPVVNQFFPEYAFPDGQVLLRDGDRIVQVGDHPVATWSQLLRSITQLSQRPPTAVPGLDDADLLHDRVPGGPTFVELDGQPVVRLVYEREEGGQVARHVLWCRLGRPPIETLVPSVLWFFLKIGLFVLGAVILWKRPDDHTATQFFWLCLVTLGAFMGGYNWLRIVTQPMLLVGFMSCAVLLPAVTLHFYLVFPRPKAFFERHRGVVLLVVYGLPLFFLALFLKGYLRVRLVNLGGAAWLTALPGDLREASDTSTGVRVLLEEILYEVYVYFAVAALWYLGTIATMIHSYRRAANVVERNQVKTLLVGSAVALVPIGYSMYLAFFQQVRFAAGGATWPMFAASVCITLAYAVSITRYRLLQLDQLLSSGALYFLICALAAIGYYGVVFAGLLLVGSQGGEGPSLEHVLGVATAALVLMVAMDVVRGRVLRVVERHFRREKHQLDRTLQRMSETIEQLVDPPTLARQLVQTATAVFATPTAAVYLRDGESGLFRLGDAVGERPPLTELSAGFPLVEALRGQPLLGPDLPGPPAAMRQLAYLHGTVASGLLHEGQLLGVLLLGTRPHAPYTAEDLNVLAACSRITVLALVSAEGHRTIEVLNRELKAKVEKIAEQQRRILALQSQLSRRETTAAEAADELADESPVPANGGGLIGSSVEVQQLLGLVRRVAASSSAVLLRGESGTGKELLARALHEGSPRAGRAFVKVHCAALSPGLLESELFGHVKGAFTSAIRDKVGRFEAADGGTLFLDEIGDISLEVQTKLLRVLEEMTFERVGSSEPVHVDVRIVAATHRDLEAMIADGRFREDLYFRLNVLPIRVPPLRERREDIAELAVHFLHLYAGKLTKPVRGIDDDALAALKGYSWPGNVRQLENVIERAVVVCEGEIVHVDDLPTDIRTPAAGPEDDLGRLRSAEQTLRLTMPELASVLQAELADRERRERDQLVRVLAAAGGNKAEAARVLGVARSTLVSRLKKFGLS